MKYYKIPFAEGNTFTYPPAILLRSYYADNFMHCEFESITSSAEEWEEINAETFENGWNDTENIVVDRTVVTNETTRSSSDIISVHIPTDILNGLKIQFMSPCDCKGIKNLTVQSRFATQTYIFLNELGETIDDGDFLKNTIVTVRINTVLNTATLTDNMINPNYRAIEEATKEIVSMHTEMKELLDGEPSAFGTGSMGTIIYSDGFKWPKVDFYGRYILQFEDFTLPEDVTMTPPEKCNGLYIYCKGACTINGTIDMRGKRLTLDSDNGITNYIQVGEKQYLLAVGGDTVKGGDGGYSGNFDSSGKSIPVLRAEGGKAGNPTAGNINGGGSNNYGLAGVAFNGGRMVKKYNHDNEWRRLDETGSWIGNLTFQQIPQAKTGGTSPYLPAAGAVVILAPKVVINGVINCEASTGNPCVNSATDAELPTVWDSNTGAIVVEIEGHCGVGTDGSQAPTGGGCITIITKEFANNGRLLTGGKSLTAVSTAVGKDASGHDSDGDGGHLYVTAGGGKAGQGGTFISQAGEIKIHIIA